MLKVYHIDFLSYASQIRSYTIFGALCWAYRLAYGDKKLESFLTEFTVSPKFLISSPFPVLKINGKDFFLFPKPILPLKNEYNSEDDVCKKKERKNYKKASYITESVLRDVIDGRINQEVDFVENEDYGVSSKGIIHKAGEGGFEKISEAAVLTRNFINRITSTSDNLYTEEAYFFKERFFMVKFYDKDFINTFENLLKVVQELGLGKNKNIGWGKIKITPKGDLQWLDEYIDNSSKFISLSPMIPVKGKINIDSSFYEFEVYKSPVENSFHQFLLKQKVIYLKEGSVLQSSKNNGFKGQLKQVLKNELIYQYGFEFPVKIGE